MPLCIRVMHWCAFAGHGRHGCALCKLFLEAHLASLLQVDACDLVPGDVVLVRLGDVVPADIKLLGEGGEHDTPMQARPCPWLPDNGADAQSSTRLGTCTGALAYQ